MKNWKELKAQAQMIWIIISVVLVLLSGLAMWIMWRRLVGIE